MKSGKILILFVSLLASISMWGMHPEGGPMNDAEVNPVSPTDQLESSEDLPDGNSEESDLEDANGQSESGSSTNSESFLNQDAFNDAQGPSKISDSSPDPESNVSETMGGQPTPQSATEMDTSLTRGTRFNKGVWRKNVNTLFESWGDRVKNAFNSAQETLGQVFNMDGAGIEPQHSLVVTHIETKPDQNAIDFENTKAKATVEFGDRDFKPRGWKEAFKDFFTRGTTRKQVLALEEKADELENNIINATDRSIQDSDLKEMSVVLDKLEFERRNLHRKWWEFKKSETKLQELQRKGEAKDVKKNNYYTLLNERADALRKMLLTSGDENDGLVRLATPEELKEAIGVAEEEGDAERVQWLKKASAQKIKDEKQQAFKEKNHSKLVQDFDGILKQYQDAQSPEQAEEFKKQLDDYAEEFKKRLGENNFSFSNDSSDLSNRLKILESDAFNNRTLNLDQWGAVVKNSPSSRVQPKVSQPSDFDPEYTNKQQKLMEQRVAERAADDARIAEIRRKQQEEVNATIARVLEQQPTKQQTLNAVRVGLENRQNGTFSDESVVPSDEALARQAGSELSAAEQIGAGDIRKDDVAFYNDWKDDPVQTVQEVLAQAKDYAGRRGNQPKASDEEILQAARKLKYIASKFDALGNTKSKTAKELSSELRDEVESRLNSLEQILKTRNIEFTPLQDTEDPAEDVGKPENNNSPQDTEEPLSTTVVNTFFQPTKEELEEEQRNLFQALNGSSAGDPDSTGKALREPTEKEKAKILKQEKAQAKKAQALEKKLAKEKTAQAKKNESNFKKAKKRAAEYVDEVRDLEDLYEKEYYKKLTPEQKKLLNDQFKNSYGATRKKNYGGVRGLQRLGEEAGNLKVGPGGQIRW